jgi:hypothetical protein
MNQDKQERDAQRSQERREARRNINDVVTMVSIHSSEAKSTD